jgi:flagellar protein FliO/FliZ
MELFGGMPDAVKFFFVSVLITAILVPLLWRRFIIGPVSPTGPRSRQPRLAVIDTTPVDVRRRLVLIKRDNVEHLLMIGGPTDIVVEANISRAGAAVREPRPIPDIARPEGARPAAAAETPDWSLPMEQMGRPARTVDLDAALPEPPARTAREAMVDSMRAVRSGAAARRGPGADLDMPPEEVAAPALTPAPPVEINHRPVPIPEPRRAPPPPEPQRPQPAPEPAQPSSEAPEPKRGVPAPPRPVPPLQPAPAPPAGGPAPRPVQPAPAAANGSAAPPAPRPAQSAAPAAPPPRQAQSADENSLAEMAQRLEAALRRPTKQPAEAPSGRLQGRAEPPAGRKPANGDAAGPKSGVKPADSPPPDLKILPGKGKSEPAMESLEDEMAKMLGRSSPGKS